MLSIYLVEFLRAFMFQIVDQSSKLTNWIKTHGPFRASNGWRIVISNAPEVDLPNKIIYLRGNDTRQDLRVHRIWDLSNQDATKTYMSEIDKALQELVNQVNAPVFVPDVAIDVTEIPMWTRKINVDTGGNFGSSKRVARA